MLLSVAGLIGARPGLERVHWKRFFEKSPLSSEYPGRMLVGLAPRLAWADRETHEQQALADGQPHGSGATSGPASTETTFF